MVFTQKIINFYDTNKTLIMVNIENGTIINSLNFKEIADLCFWDNLKKYIIIIENNFIKVLNRQTLQIFIFKEIHYPKNLLKIMKKDSKTNEINECLVLFKGESNTNESEIMLYQ